uniref:Uncharacterized protein n=1 Tax=Lepeophtheirus salmonis TaxID=72036 RepID=A0A0K2V905_LEPSM
MTSKSVCLAQQSVWYIKLKILVSPITL